MNILPTDKMKTRFQTKWKEDKSQLCDTQIDACLISMKIKSIILRLIENQLRLKCVNIHVQGGRHLLIYENVIF